MGNRHFLGSLHRSGLETSPAGLAGMSHMISTHNSPRHGLVMPNFESNQKAVLLPVIGKKTICLYPAFTALTVHLPSSRDSCILIIFPHSQTLHSFLLDLHYAGLYSFQQAGTREHLPCELHSRRYSCPHLTDCMSTFFPYALLFSLRAVIAWSFAYGGSFGRPQKQRLRRVLPWCLASLVL